MKLLVAIVNSHSREDWAQAIRSTWLPYKPEDMDVIFFRGRGATRDPLSDEVFLDCDDSYSGLPEKVRAIAFWAMSKDYDFMLKCDDDVVMSPVDLMRSGFENHDYSGTANRPSIPGRPFIVPYGFCYMLSRNSMKIIATAVLPPQGNDDELWVATELQKNRIELSGVSSYFLHVGFLVDRSKDFNRMYRPLHRARAYHAHPSCFAWCIHIAGQGDTRFSPAAKIEEFHKVFADRVNYFSK